ncbi:serine hydrolase [Streptomyces flaveolus]|uniref:serine hydrolase n=1 Tax=Streptomyces flaveolus TaxID=67297 RepID=UPI003F4DFBB8
MRSSPSGGCSFCRRAEAHGAPHAPSAGVVAQRVAQPLQVRTDPAGELAAPAGRAHGMIDPPRDHSVYDMSWMAPSASLISTVADLNRFYGMLLAGEIVAPASLAQMQRTVPVVSQEGRTIDYGLGLHPMEGPGQSAFRGHGGTVWGGGALAMTRADGKRQMAVAVNLRRWNRLDSSGTPQPHPIDDALAALYREAMYG